MKQNDLRPRISRAALKVFAKKGYSGAAVSDIASQADIGKGTIYEYFDSKEDLFFAVFKWYSKKTGAAAAVSISALGGSAAQRLEALNESLMGLWDEIKDVFALAMEFWAASSSALGRQRFQAAGPDIWLRDSLRLSGGTVPSFHSIRLPD